MSCNSQIPVESIKIPALANGIELLLPFLNEHDFKLTSCNYRLGSGGLSCEARLERGNCSVSILYRYSVGGVVYSVDDNEVEHEFLMSGLGLKESAQFPDHQTYDLLLPFRHILHDFQLLVPYFFSGSSSQLRAIANNYQQYILELRAKALLEAEKLDDVNSVNSAIACFKRNDFKGCLNYLSKVRNISNISPYGKRIAEIAQKKLRFFHF